MCGEHSSGEQVCWRVVCEAASVPLSVRVIAEHIPLTRSRKGAKSNYMAGWLAEKVTEQPQLDFPFLSRPFIITLAVDICVKTNKEEDYFVLPTALP